jgi:hypothetical protein
MTATHDVAAGAEGGGILGNGILGTVLDVLKQAL